MPAIRRQQVGIVRAPYPYAKHPDVEPALHGGVHGVTASPTRRTSDATGRIYDICSLVCLLWFNPYPEVAELVVELVTAHCNGGSGSLSIAAKHHVANLSPLSAPSDEFLQFATRVIKLTGISSETLCVAGLYIWRFRRRAPRPVVGKAQSEYRLLVVALMLANKFLDDVSFSCSSWSRFSGLPKKDLPIMEREFLKGLNFSLHVTSTQWTTWRSYEYLLAAATRELRMSQSRGDLPLCDRDSGASEYLCHIVPACE